METANIFENLPADATEEFFDRIAGHGPCRIERIVSRGHASPPGFWYDQDWYEWVIVVKGKACLSFEATGETVILSPGSHAAIPAHCRHRVEWTADGEETIWIAVHCEV